MLQLGMYYGAAIAAFIGTCLVPYIFFLILFGLPRLFMSSDNFWYDKLGKGINAAWDFSVWLSQLPHKLLLAIGKMSGNGH